jgi:hypothetical protein
MQQEVAWRDGDSAEDGVTPELSALIRELGSQVLPDPQALEWLYRGGPLP